MLRSDYYESILFTGGKKINVSRKMDASYMNKLHWHPYPEILLSLSDMNEVAINFNKYTLNMNDVAIIYPGSLHSIKENTQQSILIVQFTYELFSIMDALDKNASLFSRCPYIAYSPYASKSDSIVALIKELIETAETDAPFKEVHMYSLLLSFFEKVGQYCINAQKEDLPDAPSFECKVTRQIAEACLYISHNCAKPLTLDDISSHLSISRSHFAHLFKRYTNTTFIDFLTRERIKRAQVMFSNPNMLIIDIAFESGFSSLSSFNRAFRKITGLSPSQFRETMIS